MAELGVGFIDVLPRTDKFLSTLTTQMRSTFGKAEGEAGAAASGITKAFNVAGTALAALGAVAIGGIVKGINATTAWATQVRALQRVTGQSAEDASKLAAAGQALGLSVQQMTTAFAIFGKNIATNNSALATYGIVTRDAEGRQLDFNTVLNNAADAIQKLPPGLQQSAAAQRLFGRSGRALLPILQKGSAGMAEFYDNAERLGLVMSQDDLDAAKELTIAQHELGAAFQGASITIGKSFIPLATDIVKNITDIVATLQLIPQPLLDAGLRFAAFAGGVAIVLKVVDLVKASFANMATAAGIGGAATEAEAASEVVLTEALTANTAALIANTEAKGANAVASGEAAAATTTLAASQTAGAVAIGGATTATEAATVATEGATAAMGNLIPALAIAYGGWKTYQAVSESVTGALAGNASKYWQGITKGANLFSAGLVQVSADTGTFNQQYDTLKTAVASGGVSAEEAAAKTLELAKATGVTLPESANSLDELTKLWQQYADDLGVASTGTSDLGYSTQFLEQSMGKVLKTGADVSGIFAQMGTSAADFQTAAITAATTSDDAFSKFVDQTMADATSAWDSFKSGAQDALTFTDDKLSALTDTATQAQDALKGDTSSLGAKALADLGKQAHLTGQDILNSFQSATKATKSFGKDLLEVSKVGGQAGKDLANSLMESGNVMAAQVIADSPHKLQKQIVDSFGNSESAADRFSTKLTNAIVGPLDNIQSILQAIADAWGITVNLNDNATASLKNIKGQLETIGNQTYYVDIQGVYHKSVGPGQYASGGIITGDAGFITKGPTIMVGEGGYGTPAGRGGEAVIPLNARGGDYMRKAWGSNAAQVEIKASDMTGTLHMVDWRRGIAALDGEMAWEDMVRNS